MLALFATYVVVIFANGLLHSVRSVYVVPTVSPLNAAETVAESTEDVTANEVMANPVSCDRATEVLGSSVY